jgi:hypothetical protein
MFIYYYITVGEYYSKRFLRCSDLHTTARVLSRKGYVKVSFTTGALSGTEFVYKN